MCAGMYTESRDVAITEAAWISRQMTGNMEEGNHIIAYTAD